MVHSPRRNGLPRILDRLRANAAFPYASIFLIQFKIIWLIWRGKDITSGDTLAYFTLAKLWHEHGKIFISWSPLYTSFYGALLNFSPDAATVTMAHRMIIVLVLPLLVLALGRSLLSPLAAWTVAVWWCILPINFNALYEVHLFAVIPVLCVYLVVARIPGAWGRGIGLALLIVATVLMRNELAIPTGLFALGCLAYEWQQRRSAPGPQSIWRVARAYALPCVLAVALCGAAYSRAIDQAPLLWSMLRGKHTLNICQVYAFGYQQRHPEWTLSPWLDCHPLMQSTFGTPEPAFVEALRRNPGAILTHVAWNFSLVPSGLQALLFSCMSGGISPDYVQIRRQPWIAGAGSALVLGILVFGGRRLWLRRRELFSAGSLPIRWTWFAMCAVASASVPIIATQRPRPSYLFPLGILLMMLTARCAEELLGPARTAAIQTALPVLALAALAVAPSPYTWFVSSPRPLLAMYETLRPFASRMAAGEVLVAPTKGVDLRNLLCDYDVPCATVDYDMARRGSNVAQFLADHHAGLLLVDEQMARDPQIEDFLAHAGALGWNTVAQQVESVPREVLLEKSSGR